MAEECRGMDNKHIRELVELYTSNLKPKSDDPLERNLIRMLHNLEAAFTSNAPPEISRSVAQPVVCGAELGGGVLRARPGNCFSILAQHKECHTPMTSLCTDQATCEASASRYLHPSPSPGLRRRIRGTRPDHLAQEM